MPRISLKLATSFGRDYGTTDYGTTDYGRKKSLPPGPTGTSVPSRRAVLSRTNIIDIEGRWPPHKRPKSQGRPEKGGERGSELFGGVDFLV